jgi:DUF1365 family protein
MSYIDLEELPELWRESRLVSAHGPAPLRFRREDHLGQPEEQLDRSVRRLVRELGAKPVSVPLRLLTNLRHFGYVFNPLSLYYCFDEEDRRIEAVVADVSNTPWNERHRYVLFPESRDPASATFRAAHAKQFHVSPFMPMDLEYRWTLSEPGERLSASISCLRGDEEVLDAWLSLERRPWTAREIRRALFRFPVMTGKVIAAIHWQALLLWLKGVPVQYHPGETVTRSGRDATSPGSRGGSE